MHSDGSKTHREAGFGSSSTSSSEDDMEYDSGSDRTETSGDSIRRTRPPHIRVDNSPGGVAQRRLIEVAPKALHYLITLEKEIAETIEVCCFLEEDMSSTTVHHFCSTEDMNIIEVSPCSSEHWNFLACLEVPTMSTGLKTSITVTCSNNF